MRLSYLLSFLLLSVTNLFADSLKDLYDPTQQINRDKKSTLAQREFKTKNFSFNKPSLFFEKSLSLNQKAKTEKLVWNQTAYFADKKFEKTIPSSLWADKKNPMNLPTFAWQNKTFDAQETYEVTAAENFSFKEASGFSERYPVKEYQGDLPINVSKSLQSKKEKVLTLEEIKEILNKNK